MTGYSIYNYRKDTVTVEIEYPRHNDTEFVEVGLCDVRASDNIRISYDFGRDGWVVEQASTFEWACDDKVCDPGWSEVAFVRAWAREIETDY